MKIKSVCEQTGLTDRAIRFYIDEGLLLPACAENYLGRKSYDFSQQDVDTLRHIAVLRKFGFSVAQIKAISESPDSSRFVIDSIRQLKQGIVDAEQETLMVLSRLDETDGYTLPGLADALEEAASRQPLPRDDKAAKRPVLQFLKLLGIITGAILGFGIVIYGLVLLTDMLDLYQTHIGFDWSMEGFIAMLNRVGRDLPGIGLLVGFGIMVIYWIMILCKYGRNDRESEIAVQVIVTDKKINADSVVLGSFYTRDGGMITSIVFRTMEGQHLELTVPKETYYLTKIGTSGRLVYQGTKLVRFTPDRKKQ